MSQLFQLTIWTSDAIFLRSAVREQLERYSKEWRRGYIQFGAHVADVYLPAIKSCQSTLKQLDLGLKNRGVQ